MAPRGRHQRSPGQQGLQAPRSRPAAPACLPFLPQACMMTITFLPFTVSTCGGPPGDTLGPGTSSAGALSPAGRPQAGARSCKEEKSSRGAAPGFLGWLRRGGLQGSRGARSGGDTCRRPRSGLTAVAWACCAAGSSGLRLRGCGTWLCLVLVFAVFLNGDVPRRASGHLPVLHVCDRHRGRAGRHPGLPPPPARPPGECDVHVLCTRAGRDMVHRCGGVVPSEHAVQRLPPATCRRVTQDSWSLARRAGATGPPGVPRAGWGKARRPPLSPPTPPWPQEQSRGSRGGLAAARASRACVRAHGGGTGQRPLLVPCSLPLPQALIVVYAFHFPYLLNPQIERAPHRALYRQHILRIVLRGPALCFVAAGFSLFFYPLSYLLMAMVIFLPYVSKASSWCKGRLVGPQEPPAHSVEFFTFDLHEPLSKERVEAFSDGVYAIVATLLILDICEDNVPDSKDVRDKFHGSLVAALSAYGPHFLAYFGSFATVGLLWFAHHSLFLHIRKATQSMGLLNTLSLAFVGGLPLAYQQTSAFARQPRDELESVRVSCAIIFFASIFQFAIWTTALLQERETLQPSARFGGREHAFMFAKLALYPCASLLAFASTCFLSRVSTAIFHLTQIAVPLTFLLLRLLVRLASALLRALRGLARPAPGAEEDVRAPLLPSTC
uniref:Endosomal/lysosomal proton channel TMEM175 n=1 Tax=Canis lupus familiaris TaxID=9615 RepID=A0A8C0QAI8_CANLF